MDAQLAKLLLSDKVEIINTHQEEEPKTSYVKGYTRLSMSHVRNSAGGVQKEVIEDDVPDQNDLNQRQSDIHEVMRSTNKNKQSDKMFTGNL